MLEYSMSFSFRLVSRMCMIFNLFSIFFKARLTYLYLEEAWHETDGSFKTL